ncbi:hypothetical protein COU20_01120 [Candidatus Kaiserbacteria bacterium CG10_big_fil_rev_8_21_14_0_10_59_10]|uniref:Uncharacterized protein n=1 Tax=Candidatus Kaiserbacteria bacterium CG10_big_fil_rev_8_21_14_0_10_59_10 TaxID=1974612 RepID=A0A2H0UA79_9BACT|nr:MAG: hypothetical protein COU20_01120 [Candidatus Kaiserbacteria bacterium CG10_big_fil_rev_8_21_14_0_10_59_10]
MDNATPHTIAYTALFLALAALALAGWSAVQMSAMSRTAALEATTEHGEAPLAPGGFADLRAVVPFGPGHPAWEYPHYDSLESVAGVVESIGESSLVLREARSDALRTFALRPDTRIYTRGERKDPREHAEELAVFSDALDQVRDTERAFIAPDPFVRIPRTLSDISPGDDILVRAEYDEAVEILTRQ